jgi:signal transduction histidine kinase
VAEQERERLEERLRRAEKMEALGTLAGGVAHDLNNVLGALVGYSELLQETIPPGSVQRRYVENILQSGIRGAAIIQDLLTLARRGVAISEVVDLNQVVADYLETPELDALKARHPLVDFRTELDGELLPILGSPVHLAKAVMNLVVNAAESIVGPGEVTIRTGNVFLDRPVRGYDEILSGDYALLSVSDNGQGIPQEIIGKIFEPFYTKKIMGKSGTGLGLAVVWGAVKDDQGYIDVESQEGRGAASPLFPVTREAPAEGKIAVAPKPTRAGGKRSWWWTTWRRSGSWRSAS